MKEWTGHILTGAAVVVALVLAAAGVIGDDHDRVVALESRVTRLESDIFVNGNKIDQISERISRLEGGIDSLNQRENDRQAEVIARLDRFDERLTRIDERLDELLARK